jgi:tetraacyldisaccharide 4'-kinase
MLNPLLFLYEFFIDIREYYYLVMGRSIIGPKTISIGNLQLGGSGKTPLALRHLGQLQENKKTLLVTRGYGSKAEKSFFYLTPTVQEEVITAKKIGDEAFLIWRQLPRIFQSIGKKRLQGLTKLDYAAFSHVVLEDGFQHLPLQRDLDVVAFNTENIFKAQYLFPKGYLRYPLKYLRRAKLIYLKGWDFLPEEIKNQWLALLGKWAHSHAAIFSLEYVAVEFTLVKTGQKLPIEKFLESCQEVVLVSGLASNESFRRSIEQMGIKIKRVHFFKDHYAYTQKDMNKILQQYPKDAGTIFLCSEKDAVKMSELQFSELFYYPTTTIQTTMIKDGLWPTASYQEKFNFIP